MEVQKITSRGIHGEIVSDEYITFVKTVRQKLLQQLKEISKKIEYIKCLNCGYSGYSKDGKICPKCGKDCSVFGKIMIRAELPLLFLWRYTWKSEQDRKVLFLYAKLKNRGT